MVWHAHRVAAVVAAQGAVGFVEHLVRAAVRAVAFPAAVHAVQNGGVAPAVEQHHALLAARYAFGDGLQQRGAEHRAPWLLVHVHAPHAGQGARANPAGHVQPHVAAALGVLGRGRAAGVPALQRRGGRAQQNLGALLAPAPDGQIARGVARAFLLLVAGVVLLVDHDDFQAGQAGKNRHARA
ncbi:hypothetical protein D3C72_1843370 [compost metagenome]